MRKVVIMPVVVSVIVVLVCVVTRLHHVSQEDDGDMPADSLSFAYDVEYPDCTTFSCDVVPQKNCASYEAFYKWGNTSLARASTGRVTASTYRETLRWLQNAGVLSGAYNDNGDSNKPAATLGVPVYRFTVGNSSSTLRIAAQFADTPTQRHRELVLWLKKSFIGQKEEQFITLGPPTSNP